MEWKDLAKMTVSMLREEASKHEEIKGVRGKNKAQLMEELAQLLGIEKPQADFAEKAIQKKEDLKQKIKELKDQREKWIEAKNYTKLHEVRREIHRLKRQIKKLVIQKGPKTKKK